MTNDVWGFSRMKSPHKCTEMTQLSPKTSFLVLHMFLQRLPLKIVIYPFLGRQKGELFWKQQTHSEARWWQRRYQQPHSGCFLSIILKRNELHICFLRVEFTTMLMFCRNMRNSTRKHFSEKQPPAVPLPEAELEFRVK